MSSSDTIWLQKHFSISPPKGFDNEIYPNYYCPIIRAAFDVGEYKCDLAHFGLVPSWATTIKSSKYTHHVKSESVKANSLPRMSNETYNARSETISSKPSFRMAWNFKHFALVIVDGFFQPNYETGTPVRWIIKKPDGKPFALACLWDRWFNIEEGNDVISFCIITKDASSHPLLKRFHKLNDAKRMPVIIPELDMCHWLEANLKTANELISIEPALELIGQPSIKDLKLKKRNASHVKEV